MYSVEDITILSNRLLDNNLIKVRKQYSNNVYKGCPALLAEDITMLSRYDDVFDQQLALKRIVSERLSGEFSHSDTNGWIVNTWGRISNFDAKRNIIINGTEKNRVEWYKDALESGHLDNNLIRSISSLSKISSFIKPREYFVYDSRVAVALNWLIYRCYDELSDDCRKFFWMPQSRNKREIIMKSIINRGEDAYFSKSDSFFNYCELVKKLYDNLKHRSDLQEPAEIEILLFMLAETTPRGEDPYANVVERDLGFAELRRGLNSQNNQNTNQRSIRNQSSRIDSAIGSIIESSHANGKRKADASKHKKDGNISILGPREVMSINSHELELYVGEDKKGYLCKYKFREANVDKHEVFNGSSVLSILNGAQRTKKNYDYQYCESIEEACKLFEQVKAEILRMQQE